MEYIKERKELIKNDGRVVYLSENEDRLFREFEGKVGETVTWEKLIKNILGVKVEKHNGVCVENRDIKNIRMTSNRVRNKTGLAIRTRCKIGVILLDDVEFI